MKFIHLTTLIVASWLLFGACSNKETGKEKEKKSMSDHSSHSNMDMGTGKPSPESIYNLDSSWQNKFGNTVKLNSLGGKIQVLAMVYTSCEYACPRILADMKRIRDGLSKEALKNTNFSIVSIDPRRDTPNRLKKFAGENNLNDERWTLLHGSDGNILELAALLGFKYKRISDTDFTHSNLITLLNEKGEIVYQRKKLSAKPTKAIKKIEELSD